jgi:hypothetical protein
MHQDLCITWNRASVSKLEQLDNLYTQYSVTNVTKPDSASLYRVDQRPGFTLRTSQWLQDLRYCDGKSDSGYGLVTADFTGFCCGFTGSWIARSLDLLDFMDEALSDRQDHRLRGATVENNILIIPVTGASARAHQYRGASGEWLQLAASVRQSVGRPVRRASKGGYRKLPKHRASKCSQVRGDICL